jgi:hypothetical protein
VPRLRQVRWLASSGWGGCGGPRVLLHPRISPKVISGQGGDSWGQRFSASCQVSWYRSNGFFWFEIALFVVKYYRSNGSSSVLESCHVIMYLI